MRLAGLLLLVAAVAHAAPCRPGETALVILAEDHRVVLCERGAAIREFPVALGRGGTGKRVAGDNRTPLGEYPLGAPRSSSQYGTFIPIAYPTAEQRRRGYTGGDIGVHGPRRGARWLGRLNNAVDWTRGCVAVATDETITEIARWVRRARPRTARIE